MKNFLLFTLLSFSTLFTFAQDLELKGVVRDAVTQETLIQASVLIGDSGSKGTVTDFDGNYSILLAPGTYEVIVRYIGYKEQRQTVTLSGGSLVLHFNLEEESVLMDEIKVVADVARSRETPVAFSTIPQAQIQEEISVQDLPMVLNSTPGVYATQQGGGDGDARITIRGFNQRNIAILIDGVPVNDMENGWVYWSNWSGLGEVTRSMQVQRGLGASKLALPSVGGTINVLTSGIESKRKFTAKQEVGDNGYLKTSLSATSGRLDNGFGITAAASYKQGDGWVENTFTKAWFYFLKVEKTFGKHNLSISAVGAPQEHGQRSFKGKIADFDKETALDLFKGTDEQYDVLVENDAAIATLLSQYTREENPISEEDFSNGLNALGVNDELLNLYRTGFINVDNYGDYGVKYNQHWGELDRIQIVDGDTIFNGQETLAERLNYYHKPQFTIKDFWTPSNKLSISNILYLSIGNGGGVRGSGSGFNNLDENGHTNFQAIYNSNAFPFFPNPDGNPSSNILMSSVNNHTWYGLLSTFDYEKDDNWSISGGLDLRHYTGVHTREVYDLLGGDYFVDSGTNFDWNAPTGTQKQIGDKIDWHYDSTIKWGGIFTQTEYKQGPITAFVNVTGAITGSQRKDYFAKKDLVLADTTYSQVISANIPFVLEGDTFTIDSPQAQFSETEQKWTPGFTIKTGMNYNINSHYNVFFNTGYISKAAPFDNVFSRDNRPYPNTVNEKIAAAEIGAGAKYRKFALNFNGYYTAWINRPLIASVENNETGDLERRNVTGLKALHRGIEVDFAYEVVPKFLKWEGLISWGDWIWKTDSTALLQGEDNLTTRFSANGVHVGDAAQFQLGSSIRIEPVKRLYATLRWNYSAKNFSDFTPDQLTGKNGDREVWQMPNYHLFSAHAGYSFNVSKLKFNLGVSVLNIFDTVYISDGSNRDGFNLQDIEVFFGAGRRVSSSLKLTF